MAGHSLAGTFAPGARRTTIALVLALLAGCVGIIPTYQPPLLPIAISMALDGSIEVSFDPAVVTPIGTFSLSVPAASFKIPPADTLLVILVLAAAASGASAQHGGGGLQAELARYDAGYRGGDVGGTQVTEQEFIEIKRDVKMRFLVDGAAGMTQSGNTVMLSPGSGASEILVQNADHIQNAPRFSVEHETPLPSPPRGIAVPTARPASWPTPSVTCTTPDLAGTVTCTASPAGSYTYQWFDRSVQIGTGNPLKVTLPVGDHLITATVTASSGFSFSSPATAIGVKISSVAAFRGSSHASDAII